MVNLNNLGPAVNNYFASMVNKVLRSVDRWSMIETQPKETAMKPPTHQPIPDKLCNPDPPEGDYAHECECGNTHHNDAQICVTYLAENLLQPSQEVVPEDVFESACDWLSGLLDEYDGSTISDWQAVAKLSPCDPSYRVPSRRILNNYCRTKLHIQSTDDLFMPVPRVCADQFLMERLPTIDKVWVEEVR